MKPDIAAELRQAKRYYESDWDAEKVEIKTKKRSPERDLLGMVKRSFDKAGMFFFKIPDMPHFEGSGIRFDIEKPFDAFALYGGIPLAIEAKWLPKTKAIGMQSIRHCQEVGLDKWVASGGVSLLMIGIGRGKETWLVILNWEKVRDQLKAGRSIKKCELEKMLMVQVKKGEFDLSRPLMIAATSCLPRK